LYLVYAVALFYLQLNSHTYTRSDLVNTKHKNNSWPDRLRVIFRATRTHATNLAKFVALYKTLLLLQKSVNSGKPRSHDTFVAGLLSGYTVFGERTAINEQVRFFLLSFNNK
jgi:hypothetical protein